MAEMTARVSGGEGFLARVEGKIEFEKPIQMDLLPPACLILAGDRTGAVPRCRC
jgi:hypothetical protein